MSYDAFERLLKELEEPLNAENLKPDKNNSCLLRIRGDIEIQLELDPGEEYLIIGSKLGELDAGSYRTNIFREALKTNGLGAPRYGILGFSRIANQLLLFERLKLSDTKAPEVAALLGPFTEKAAIWKEAVTRGEVPYVSASGEVGTSGGMFGMKP